MAGVETSAIVTVVGAFGVGGLISVVLKHILDRAARHVDSRSDQAKSYADGLAKQYDDLFDAQKNLRADLSAQMGWLRQEWETSRVSLRAAEEEIERGREHRRRQDEALKNCEIHSAECTRQLGELNAKHEDLSARFAESEDAREALRTMVNAMDLDRKAKV